MGKPQDNIKDQSVIGVLQPMPTKINMHLEFVPGTGGTPRSFTYSISHDGEASDNGRENLAREMFAELRKAISYSDHWRSLPDVGDLLQSPASAAVRNDPMAFIDVFNVPAVWLEISNTFTDLRHVLAQAKAFKDLEPPNTKPTTDSLCAHLHFEKMYRLNLGVFQLVKIQDLIARLLHESFSGKLITIDDYDDEDWEEKLTLKSAKKGLKAFADNGDLSDRDYQAILAALDLPSKSPHQDTVIRYRNRLTHRIRPSVDYAELFADLQDRAGEVIKDGSGKEKGRVYSVGGRRSQPDFLFADLYRALSDYMRYVGEMLKSLKAIPRLS